MASGIAEQTDSVQVTVSFLLPLILTLKIACCFMSIYKSAYFILTWNILCLTKSISSQPQCTLVQERKATDNRTLEKCLCHLVLCDSPAETGEMPQHCHMDGN